MKKIALVYMSDYVEWPLGGMLTYVRNIIPPLGDTFDIELFGSTIDGEKKCDSICLEGKEYPLHIYSNVKTCRKIIPNFVVSFFSLIKNRKMFSDFDVIYSHTSATTLAARLCFPHKKIVHHQHGLSYKKAGGVNRIYSIAFELAQNVSDLALIVASKELVAGHIKEKHKKNGEKYYAIPSPIEFKGDKGYCHDALNQYIYTGRLDAHKNIILLIDAFELFARNNAATLKIIGEGPLRKEVDEYLLAKGLNDRIILVGKMKHEDTLLEVQRSKGLLFPSKGEGMSLSVLEALSYGVPVACFDVEGMNNIIVSGENGVVAREITPVAFAEAIEYLELNGEKMRAKCVESVKAFDANVVGKEIAQLILGL